ncbi:MAG TPA: serine/threonine-protein kinase [Polyangia bacterium]|nr:serine/threonine-protein kinase [Polyangia bacterium]
MAKHGRYKIVRKVADGGMAEIFLATQLGREGFQKPVILKRIHTTIYADPQFRNMFLDEAHISMGLSHSNIVQMLDLGVGNGRYFLVMEVVDGWDLGRVLHRATNAGTPLPRELGLYVCAEVCRALAYAHGKVDPTDGKPLGIVHRDVSPQNILLSEQGEVKLTDFGIAKAMNKREHTGTGVVKGKVAFMSPEQALGKPIDARSDLFAVGTVLYQLMTRVRPFEAPTDLEVLLRVQHAEFKPAYVVASDLPAEVDAILTRAMQLDPELRFQSAEEMLTAIEDVLRTVFRPVGQTELKRWLAGLAARDGQAPMSKAVSTPPPGRITTGEMEGKDVELFDSTTGDVDGEEATSLASFAAGGELRPRLTRQRAAEELSLPVPPGTESAMSGRHEPLELPLDAVDERPGRRRARRGGSGSFIFLGLVILGGAALGGRYYRLQREKDAGATTPAPAVAEPAPPSTGDEPSKDKDDDKIAKTEKKKAAAASPDASAGEVVARKPRAEKSEKAEKSESARRIEELKNQMAPDPSLEPTPTPAPTEPPPAPAQDPSP